VLSLFVASERLPCLKKNTATTMMRPITPTDILNPIPAFTPILKPCAAWKLVGPKLGFGDIVLLLRELGYIVDVVNVVVLLGRGAVGDIVKTIVVAENYVTGGQRLC
jgi:hypothetical protein